MKRSIRDIVRQERADARLHKHLCDVASDVGDDLPEFHLVPFFADWSRLHPLWNSRDTFLRLWFEHELYYARHIYLNDL